MSKLTNGRIPLETECPFKSMCTVHMEGGCNRKDNMSIPFSCGTARGFDILMRGMFIYPVCGSDCAGECTSNQNPDNL